MEKQEISHIYFVIFSRSYHDCINRLILCIWICEFTEVYWLLHYFNIISRYCTNINGQLRYKTSFRKRIFNPLIPAALISILFVSSFLSLGHEYCAISWGFGMCYSYITYTFLNLSASLLCFKFFFHFTCSLIWGQILWMMETNIIFRATNNATFRLFWITNMMFCNLVCFSRCIVVTNLSNWTNNV